MSGIKYDTGKTQLELLPVEALEEVAKVLTFGAQKYDEENWRGGFKYKRIVGSTLRHIYAWVKGENKDPETGLSHLSHAACNLLFLITFEQTDTGEDDRYIYGQPKQMELFTGTDYKHRNRISYSPSFPDYSVSNVQHSHRVSD